MHMVKINHSQEYIIFFLHRNRWFLIYDKLIFATYNDIHHLSVYMPCICLLQKVADDKGAKAKKGGVKGKKEDGPAQNGETKTNEVQGGQMEESTSSL